MKRSASFKTWWHRLKVNLYGWIMGHSIRKFPNQKLEEMYNRLINYLPEIEEYIRIEKLRDTLPVKYMLEGKEIELDGPLQTDQEVVANLTQYLEKVKQLIQQTDEEIKKRNLKKNQLPNGKFYLMAAKRNYAQEIIQRAKKKKLNLSLESEAPQIKIPMDKTRDREELLDNIMGYQDKTDKDSGGYNFDFK